MKRSGLILCAMLGLALSSGQAHASWGQLTYSGYQPWYNIFAKRYKCLTPEEERLQKFWHDYYHALKSYYSDLDHIDWVAYYKNHGYQINCCGPGGCCGRVNYAPVFVSPTMQWAAPTQPVCGPPVAGPGMGGAPPGFGPMGGPGHGPGPMGGPGFGPPPMGGPGYGPPPMGGPGYGPPMMPMAGPSPYGPPPGGPPPYGPPPYGGQ